jgi:outer membrane murein-binding lipoprotein Lpp
VGAPARLAADRLRTTNGHSVGDYVEQLASDVQQVRAEVGEVKSEIGIVTGWAAENRDLAHEAKTLAQHAHERFDAWLAGRRADKEG